MKRHALVIMLALAIAETGCARGRAALPPDPLPGFDPLEPAAVPTAPEPPRTSTREGKIPLDLTTIRASYESEEAEPEPADDPKPMPRPVSPRPAPAAEKPKAATPKPGDPSMTIRTDPDLAPGKPASFTAAVVGDTIITGRELLVAVRQRTGMKPHEMSQVPQAELMAMSKDTLETLIDRTLILQEGRRDIKKDAQWNTFTEFVEKAWREKELPPMLRKAGVEDEIALRKKLEESGESLDDMKDGWKLEQMSRELLMMRVQPKVEKPNLPEMEAYYAKHRTDPKYHRDAKVQWREIVIPVNTPADLASAKQKAATLRARLMAGEDFAKLAKTTSAGATAAEGGIWKTAPDGNAIPAINQALAKLPLNQVSAPIEGPKGIHVIRVESRRTAGIAPFVEVQREIAETIFGERFQAAIASYLKKLRDRTSVTSPLFREAPAVADEKAKTDSDTKRTSGR